MRPAPPPGNGDWLPFPLGPREWHAGCGKGCLSPFPERSAAVIPSDSPSVIPSEVEGSGWGRAVARPSPARVTGATLPSLARTRLATAVRRGLPLADQRLAERRPDPLDRARARDRAQQRPAPGLGVAEVRVRFQESWAHLMGILSTDLGARLVFFEVSAHVRSVMCGFRHSDRSEGSRWGRPLPGRNMERSPR